MTMFTNERVTINKKWLYLEADEFKVLLYIAINNNKISSLKEIREFLKLCNCKKNNDRIKNALENLKEKKYIEYSKTGNTFKITLISNNDKCISIRMSWVEMIRNYNKDNKNRIIDKKLPSANWGNMLKLLIYMYYNGNEYNNYIGYGQDEAEWKIVNTYKKIGEELNASKYQISNSLKALKKINLDGVVIKHKIKKLADIEETGDINFITIGSVLYIEENAW